MKRVGRRADPAPADDNSEADTREADRWLAQLAATRRATVATELTTEEREWLEAPVSAEILPPWADKRTRNQRRAARRRLLRLRLRRDYIKEFVVDGRDDEIEGWILAGRVNGGQMPAGLIGDAELAARVELAVRLPFKEIQRVQHRLRTSGTGSARSRGIGALKGIIPAPVAIESMNAESR